MPIPSNPRVRFGVFEADLATWEIWERGRKIPIQNQPFRLLRVLLERPGEAVTYDELTQILWADNPPSEPDHSLSIAVAKVREMLGDSATNPRFVETLPKRRALRFIAAVEQMSAANAQAPAEPQVEGDAEGRSSGLNRLALLGVGVVLAAAFIFAMWRSDSNDRMQRAGDQPLRRFTLAFESEVSAPSISPDGRYVAFISGNPLRSLWIHDLMEDKRREIAGTQGARSPYSTAPFWSPDSRSIGFATEHELKKVSIDSGLPVVLCRLGLSFGTGSWSPDGRSIVFFAVQPGGMPRLFEVDAQGGEPKLLFQPGKAEGKMAFFHPYFLPSQDDSRMLLYAVGFPGKSQIVLRNLDTGHQDILADGALPVYSPNGHIIYQMSSVANGLWALPFSLQTLKATGDPFSVDPKGVSASSASDGTLCYVDLLGGGKVQLVWRDRSGKKLGLIGQPQQEILFPALSPDEKRVVVSGVENGGSDVWLHHVDQPSKTRVSREQSLVRKARWSPSGKITFSASVNGIFNIFNKPADADGVAASLLASSFHEFACDWSVDEKYLLFYRHDPEGVRDIWYLRRKDDESGYEEQPFLRTQFSELSAKFSPDGRFVVYVSDEAGAHDVYVRPFPEGAERWKVSVGNGGGQPRWSDDGSEIFYVEGDTLIATDVSTKPRFSVKGRQRLFQSAKLRGWLTPNYDVSRDGNRFVVVEPVGEGPRPTIKIVQNWLAEFQERVEY